MQYQGAGWRKGKALEAVFLETFSSNLGPSPAFQTDVSLWFCSVPPDNYSVAVVRKQTIPTERLPLVGEVSAKLCG
jgi:hypothetical protein